MYFVKYRDNRGEWRWTYYATNHEEIAVSSGGYKGETACDRSITLMKGCANAPVKTR